MKLFKNNATKNIWILVKFYFVNVRLNFWVYSRYLVFCVYNRNIKRSMAIFLPIAVDLKPLCFCERVCKQILKNCKVEDNTRRKELSLLICFQWIRPHLSPSGLHGNNIDKYITLSFNLNSEPWLLLTSYFSFLKIVKQHLNFSVHLVLPEWEHTIWWRLRKVPKHQLVYSV